ncbi:hypothetical protein HYPSUDRAFT_199915 [Hypholoma sublateritium FD-334 SS-4]|uniref:Uncharacterized protein n=1 Tax=Hypholoma sublateritium (strain FD-334 SS-4) TaxID=945553 RepID=A0A0D2MN62_HYPSF|nr:hypothetical protein HYPSUDRAFT_199915 [Hypholoma sublateritium FD-334 SS-4]
MRLAVDLYALPSIARVDAPAPCLGAFSALVGCTLLQDRLFLHTLTPCARPSLHPYIPRWPFKSYPQPAHAVRRAVRRHTIKYSLNPARSLSWSTPPPPPRRLRRPKTSSLNRDMSMPPDDGIARADDAHRYNPPQSQPRDRVRSGDIPRGPRSAGRAQRERGQPTDPPTHLKLPYVPMPPGPITVQLPPLPADLAVILQETRVAQLATVEQQRELTRYVRSLNGWLARDAHERQAEMRGVVERVDELGDALRSRDMQRSQSTRRREDSSADDSNVEITLPGSQPPMPMPMSMPVPVPMSNRPVLPAHARPPPAIPPFPVAAAPPQPYPRADAGPPHGGFSPRLPRVVYRVEASPSGSSESASSTEGPRAPSVLRHEGPSW